MTQLGLGGSALGELFVRMRDEDALALVDAAWSEGIRYFDTAPWYGRGLSELRVGAGLRGHPRDEYVLSTKVGRWLRPAAGAVDRGVWAGGLPFEVEFDYSYDGIMRSLEQSQLRIGIVRFDLAIVHDLDHLHHSSTVYLNQFFQQLVTSGWRALTGLRDAGFIRGIGIGINAHGLIPRFLEVFDPDFFLVAMPYTLLDQEVLDDEFPLCVERGVGVIVGSVFASKILATGAVGEATYDYEPAPATVVNRVRRIDEVCHRHGVDLATAALQFPLGHPAVAAVIPGASSAAQVRRNADSFRTPIPGDLWAELKRDGLLRDDAPVPP